MDSDSRELMYGAKSADNGPVPYMNMPSHLYIISNDTMIAYTTIMGYMGISYDYVMASKFGFPMFFCTPTDGGIYPNRCISPDRSKDILPFVFEILRYVRYDRSGIDFAVFPYAGPFIDHDI